MHSKRLQKVEEVCSFLIGATAFGFELQLQSREGGLQMGPG